MHVLCTKVSSTTSDYIAEPLSLTPYPGCIQSSTPDWFTCLYPDCATLCKTEEGLNQHLGVQDHHKVYSTDNLIASAHVHYPENFTNEIDYSTITFSNKVDNGAINSLAGHTTPRVCYASALEKDVAFGPPPLKKRLHRTWLRSYLHPPL